MKHHKIFLCSFPRTLFFRLPATLLKVRKIMFNQFLYVSIAILWFQNIGWYAWKLRDISYVCALHFKNSRKLLHRHSNQYLREHSAENYWKENEEFLLQVKKAGRNHSELKTTRSQHNRLSHQKQLWTVRKTWWYWERQIFYSLWFKRRLQSHCVLSIVREGELTLSPSTTVLNFMIV